MRFAKLLLKTPGFQPGEVYHNKLVKPYLSVVIPAYNEAKNFRAGVLIEPLSFLKKQKYPWEVIFVDDGSNDDTPKLLKKLVRTNKNLRLLAIPHGGKAAAVRAGILAASGKIILFTDFDQSTPLPQITKFLAAHKKGADIAIAVRGHSGKAMANDTWPRRLRSLVFIRLVQLIALPGIRDSQCGFKSFRNQAAKKIFSSLVVSTTAKPQGAYMGAFDVEALFLARKMGLTIAQIPVDWKSVSSEKLNLWREPLLMLIDLFKIRRAISHQ